MWEFCLISLLITIAAAQTNYPFVVAQPITASTPIISDLFAVNAKAGSQMTIIHLLPIQVCFHTRSLRGISPIFWNMSCHFYFSYEASQDGRPITSVETVFLRDAPAYYVAISLTDLSSTATDNIDFGLGVIGDSCLTGQVYDSLLATCLSAETMSESNTSAPLTMVQNEVKYYQFTVPANGIGQIIAYVPSLQDESKLIFLFRLMGTPTNSHKDGTSGSTAFLAYPRPGLYTLRVRAAVNVTNVVFALRFEHCSGNNMTGPSCGIFYNSSVENAYVPTRAGVNNYWAFPCLANSVSSVSIRPDDGDLWNYQIFASMGQLPNVPANSDILNCYGSSCLGAWNINITTGAAAETWYIAVLPAHSNRTYSIWFNSVCSPLCNYHGLCTSSGEFIGQCACSADYMGASCQLSTKLSAQYIVLIIIACLLFTSAIAGFVAQAYLKRKGYQNL